MTDSVKRGLKIVIVVAVSAAVGIILGCLVSNYELRYMFSREYYNTVKGIEIYTCGDINDEICLAHISMIDHAPEELAACCSKIYFTGGDLPVSVTDMGFGQPLGVTQGDTVFISTRSFGADVVLHELFHTYDREYGTLSSNDGDFIVAFSEEGSNIRLAAADESLLASEFFAESGAMYIISPFELEIRAPKTYKYFNKLFRIYE